jgi:signal transduction histidine kinase
MDEAERARRRVVNDLMRHDLRTRFTIGKGYAAVLRASYDALAPEQRDQAMAGLLDAFDKVEVFSRRVLLDEQLEVDPSVEPGDVPVAGVLAAVRAAYPSVVTEVAPDAPATVRADPMLLREVVDNLVANAVVAAGGATLKVLGSNRFEVCDTGPGIPPDELPAVWDRYVRTARSLAAREPGLGLGLPIVRRVMDLHGGTYGAASDATGTTFWVAF